MYKSVSPLLTIIMLCVMQAKRLANNEWAAIKVIKLEPGISQCCTCFFPEVTY